MKGLSKLQVSIILALAAFMLVICIISFVTPVSWLNKPFPGFLIYAPPYVGSYSVEDWPGRTAGLKFLDRIVAVNGQPVKHGRDVIAAVRKLQPGTPVQYVVESKGERREVAIPVAVFGIKDFLLTFLMTNFLCGLVFCLLGFIVILMKPNIFSSWIFMLWSLVLGGYLISGFEIMSSHRLVNYHYLTACLYPVMAMHVAFVFPDANPILKRFPALHYLIYVPFVVLIIGWQIYLFLFPQMLDAHHIWASLLSYKFLGSVTRLLLFMCLIVSIVLMTYSYRRAPTVTSRQRAKMILLGVTIGWVIPVFIMFGSHLMKMSPTWNFLPFLVIFFPASVAYSIVRHNLFDADVIIRRTIGYVVVTAVVLFVYGLVSVSLNVYLGHYQLAQSKLFPILFTLFVILVFNPMRDRIQSLVDRVFFRAEYDYGAVIEKVGRAMTSLLDLDQIIRRLTQTFTRDMFVGTSSVMLLSPDGQTYSVYMAQGEMQDDLGEISYTRDEPLMKVFESEKKELTQYDLLEDPKYKEVCEVCNLNFEALHASLMVPMVYHDNVIGILSLSDKKSGKQYNREDIDLLRTVANQGAVAIENARLFQENLEKQRMEEELSIARDLQLSMLPAQCPVVEGFEIAATSMPAREVGGDFYDFIDLGEEKIGFVIGDVTGKSVSGALVMSAARSVLRMLSEENIQLGELMARANRRSKKDMRSGMFIALLYAELNTKKKVLGLCSAGQTQPIHYSVKNGKSALLETEGDTFPLGILPEADYKETELQLSPGDRIVFYTDGIVEAMNENKEIFGFERLIEIIDNAHAMDAKALLDEILASVQHFVGGAEQHDDLTAIVISVTE